MKQTAMRRLHIYIALPNLKRNTSVFLFKYSTGFRAFISVLEIERLTPQLAVSILFLERQYLVVHQQHLRQVVLPDVSCGDELAFFRAETQ